MTPKGVKHLYVLGGCADISRDTAEQLLRPLNSLQFGQRSLAQRLLKKL